MKKELKEKIDRLNEMKPRHDELVYQKHFEEKVYNEEEQSFINEYIKLINEIDEESMSEEQKQSMKNLDELLEKTKKMFK